MSGVQVKKWSDGSPSEWKVDRLKDCMSAIVGGEWGDEPGSEVQGQDLVVLRVADFTNGTVKHDDLTIRRIKESKILQRQLTSSSLLIEKSGGGEKQWVGRVVYPGVLPFDAICSNFIAKLEVAPTQDAKFLNYLFSALYDSKVNWPHVRQTTGIQNLALYHYLGVKVSLPSLPEQKRIAAYLDASCASIDRAVQTKQKQLQTLDALRKSIIQRAVTEGLNPKAKMKIVPMDGVGHVPAHWRVKQLRYVCDISYGITLQLEAGKTEGISILTVQNLDIHGDWKFDQEFCIDEDLVNEDDILKHGDLLFNWRNGSARHVGKTAFFDLKGRYTHVSFLLRMRCGKDLSPFYLKSYLGALRMAGFFEGSKDKVNKTFNSTELNRLSVLLPPIDEQREIVTFVQQKCREIEKAGKVIEDQITTLTAYRKSLIHESVTGKRRISDADVAKVEAHV